jgi:shikimate kinase
MILPENSHFFNIVLIGMAGAGKSTVGPLLAERLNFSFLDTDDLIANARSSSLQQLLDRLGVDRFRILEEQTLVAINVNAHVIATGGSAVYSRAGMGHLHDIGLIVWLDVALAELEVRVRNLPSRGLVNPDGGSFAQLYQQRFDFYRQYADLRIRCTGKGVQSIVDEIVRKTGDWHKKRM